MGNEQEQLLKREQTVFVSAFLSVFVFLFVSVFLSVYVSVFSSVDECLRVWESNPGQLLKRGRTDKVRANIPIVR